MKYLAIAFYCAILALGSAYAMQGDAGLAEILLNNGAITQEQYDKLKKEAPANERNQSADYKLTTEGGFEVSSYDGRFSFQLGGRFGVDAAFYNEEKNPLGNGTEIRTARVEFEGTVFADWNYEYSMEFSDAEVEIKDAFLEYNGFGPLAFRIGNFKTPFSMEQMGSKKHVTFMERALPNTLVPDRKVGVGAYYYAQSWTAAAGFFGDDYDVRAEDEGDSGWTSSGRLTFAPLRSDTRVFHVGASAAYQVPNADKEWRVKTDPDSHLTKVDYLNTGKIKDLSHSVLYGIESAMVYGPFSLQGEYVHTILDIEEETDNPSFYGGYVFASWMITGESRNYKFKKGSFGRLKPDRSYGALELAVRYSMLDLNSPPLIYGGREDNITVAFNWYFNPFIRLMTNYVIVNNDEFADDDENVIGNDDIGVFQARLQFDF